MSAEQDSSARGRGSTDAGRPAGPAPHPARAIDAQARGAAADGSAWDDGADGGDAAWDDTPSGAVSAWDSGADEPAAVWDAPVPVARGGWDDGDVTPTPSGTSSTPGAAPEGGVLAGRGSEGDDGASAPASAWDDDAPAPASAWDDDAPASASASASASAPAPAPASSRAARAGAESDAVAAVAARLAEIVGRSPADRAPAHDDVDPGPPADGSGRYGRGTTSRSGRSANGSGGTRRTGGGRRRAPATEPPEDGSAAVDAEPDHESVARTVALRLLTGAPKSRQQLAEAMAKRDVPEEVADKVLDRFTEVGLVDDAAYAEILVRSRHTERGLSRRALAQELRRRGVDDETAQGALEQVDDADEEEAARALARKKLRATRGLDREVRLRRAYGALGRRGYGGSLVSRVVREELDAEGARDDEEPAGWSGGFGGG